MKSNRFFYAGLMCLACIIGGCISVRGPSQGRVEIVDSDSRTHLENRLTLTDLVDLSERLTNRIFSSNEVIQWSEKKVKPILIVGELINDTYDENLRIRDIEEKVNETIKLTDIVRIVGEKSTNYDYIMTMRLTEQRQGSKDGRALSEFLLRMTIKAIDGELIGSWSERFSLAKSERDLI